MPEKQKIKLKTETEKNSEFCKQNNSEFLTEIGWVSRPQPPLFRVMEAEISEPTRIPPGTTERIELYCLRADAGLPLFIPGDRSNFEGLAAITDRDIPLDAGRYSKHG